MKLKKIFVVGFPKSGTRTINKALESCGISSAHWKVEEGFIGKLMYEGDEKYNNPWYYLSKYNAITQADVCLPNENLNYWPNLDFSIIKNIEQKYPTCLFLLNYRDPNKIIASIKKWIDLQQRIITSEIIGLPKGKGNDVELKLWIESHFNKLRKYFKNKENFLEIDIANNNAPIALGKKLKIDIKWWENKNPWNKINVGKLEGLDGKISI